MMDFDHDTFCRCDTCEGVRFILRHVPADALFDGDFRHRGTTPRRKHKVPPYLTGGTG